MARAFLFVCSGDKTCPRAEGQGDDGVCCSAAGAFVALSRSQGQDGRPEPMLRRSASRGSASLYFISVASRCGDRGHPLLVECCAVTGGPSLRPLTGLKLGARRSYK